MQNNDKTQTLCNFFLQSISLNLQQHRLVSNSESKILVAVSGGADSVALLCALQMLGYNCGVAHCNFQLRGNESVRDELFVKSLCSKLNVPFHTIQFDTKNVAKQLGISIEMAARDLRYDFFELTRTKFSYEVIAVAHHQEDNAETLLLNLIRGTGIHGLTGMKPKKDFIVRPMLNLTKEDIHCFLKHIRQNFIEDSSNAVPDVKRNIIRLKVIPLLKKMNPAVVHTLTENIQRLNEAENLYNFGIETLKEKICHLTDKHSINIKKLIESPSPATVLYEILSPYGFNATQAKNIFQAAQNTESGAIFKAKDWIVTKNRNTLLIVRNDFSEVTKQTIQLDAPIHVNNHILTATLLNSAIIDKTANTACIDASKINFKKLTLRSIQTGDRFVPFGMKGSKLISDYLTDKKRSRIEKQQALVVCNDHEIVWLVGERVSNNYAVKANSLQTLKLTIDN